MGEFRSVLKTTAVALAAALVAAPLGACVPPRDTHTHDQTVRTKTLAWTGGDRLFVALAADVRYVQGQDAKVVVTGPADEIEDIVVDGGVIRYGRERGWGFFPFWHWRDWGFERDVNIVVTAPQITGAGVGGSGHLDLGRLNQDRLEASVSGSGSLVASGQIKSLAVAVSGSGSERLDQINAGDMTANLSGSGWIRGTGTANSLRLGVSGSGAADLGGLTVQDAEAHLSGSGSASLSPKQSADISVFGSGAVRLLTQPPKLSTHHGGSGAIILPGGSRD
jgi:hypothetical protein